MITHLYVNNFRCLVAFEAKLGPFGVLCGPNGAGKSSVFDAVAIIRDLAVAEATVDQAFRFDDHTRWLSGDTIEFEIGLRDDRLEFMYRLHVQQTHETVKPRIVLEEALCDGRTLFARDLDGVRFVKASGAEAGFPLDWRQAAIGAIQPAADRREIEALQGLLANLLVLRPNPMAMEAEAESRQERQRPAVHLGDIVSWYRYLALDQDRTDHLRELLAGVWPDFRSFGLVSTGLQAKALQLKFDGADRQEAGTLFFHQLSAGEKMLVGLYMVRTALATGLTQTVLIDEPDNFVGLPELQPWVTSTMELLGDRRQAIMISHHPEILSLAGEQFGRYLWRDNHTAPTRIGPLRTPPELSIGEAVTRGWVNA